MPRIAPGIVRLAKTHDPLLAKLLPVCRTLDAARNELRWLKESVRLPVNGKGARARDDQALRLHAKVDRRSKGEPLQYILGTEYFGDLEIKCRPGVLIPRQDTAASVKYLVDKINTSWLHTSSPNPLKLLDLCVGSACIPLLYAHEFYKHQVAQGWLLDMVGVDISSPALELARENQVLQSSINSDRQPSNLRRSIDYLQLWQANILGGSESTPTLPSLQAVMHALSPEKRKFHILTSNPPYVSSQQYKSITSPSVRRFEPRSALVPQQTREELISDGDVFYPRLWQIADLVDAEVVLFEIADHEQALRVIDMASRCRGGWSFEVLRDDPTATDDEAVPVIQHGRRIPVIGSGHSRSVLACRVAATQKE